MITGIGNEDQRPFNVKGQGYLPPPGPRLFSTSVLSGRAFQFSDDGFRGRVFFRYDSPFIAM